MHAGDLVLMGYLSLSQWLSSFLVCVHDYAFTNMLWNEGSKWDKSSQWLHTSFGKLSCNFRLNNTSYNFLFSANLHKKVIDGEKRNPWKRAMTYKCHWIFETFQWPLLAETFFGVIFSGEGLLLENKFAWQSNFCPFVSAVVSSSHTSCPRLPGRI
jgi:hypothetical protein